MIKFRTAAAALVLGSFVSTAHATILYDNSGTATGGYDPIAHDGPQYNSFMTDVTGRVDDVGMLLDNQGLPNGNGSVMVTLYNDGGDFPNDTIAKLGTITDDELTSTPTLFGFSNLGLQLSSDTMYWVGLTDMTRGGTSSIEWSIASDSSGVGVASQWTSNSFSTQQNGPAGAGLSYQMCVSYGDGSCNVSSAAPVPEPATFALMGVSLAALGLVCRHLK